MLLRAPALWGVLAGVLLLEGCGPATTARRVLAGQCVRLDGARQEVTLPVRVPGRGLLYVAVRERGISAVAALGSADGSWHEAASPIDRLGTITLAKDVSQGDDVPVRIASIDSPGMSGDVCVSAELMAPSDGAQASAERLLAAGGEATYRRQWQNAFGDYLGAARLFDHLGLRAAAAAARHSMAELAYGYMQRGRDSIALVAATLGKGAARDPATLGTRLTLLAKALMDLPGAGETPLRTARNLLSAAARLYRSSALGRRELPRLEILEGFLEYRTGRPAESYRLFDAAAADCKSLGDWECFARARQNVAALAEERQNYAAALAAYEQALGSLDASRMPMLAADISYNLARLEGRVGFFVRSEQAQKLAMRLYAQLGQCDRARRSASSLGEMLVHVGSISDATVYLNRAATLGCSQLLAVLEQPADAPGTSAVEETGGGYGGWRPHGRQGAASTCARPAFNGSTMNDDIAVFQAFLSLSEIARADDHFRTAETCLAAARKYSVDARTEVRLVNASGELELELGHPRAADGDFDRALRLSHAAALARTSEFQGVTELGLAETDLVLGEAGEAQRHAYAALQLSSARADVTRMVDSLRLLASSYAAAGHPAIAARTLRAAISLIEQVPTGELDAAERATYLATQHSVFADLTDLLANGAEGGTGEAAWNAFAVAEQGHARSLRYAMEQAAREHASAPVQAESQGYRALLRTLAGSAQRRGNDRGGELLRTLTRIALPQAMDATPLDRNGLSVQLHRMRATLIEYAVGRDDMFAFVTDGTRMHVTRLATLADISKAAENLSELLRAPEPVPFEIRASARRLARLVLWPIRSDLTQGRIIFVPDGALHTVPFAVLPWSDAASSELVLEHAEISSVPSALLLTRRDAPQAPSPGRGRFVLLGDPVFRSTKWYRSCAMGAAQSRPAKVPRAIKAAFAWSRSLPSLPGSRTEVLSVGRIVHRWRSSANVQTLLQCAATAHALREAAPGAEVLHIATHGLVDARRPRLSALALTPDTPSAQNAAFRLLDILRLPLHARMVVLSACDTSRGRLLPGEGVLGLAQAFLQAGAESVVASYWRVDDAATVPFMEKFYRHLLVDGLPAAAALRRTQLEQAAASESYSWAAFSLYGRPDSTL